MIIVLGDGSALDLGGEHGVDDVAAGRLAPPRLDEVA